MRFMLLLKGDEASEAGALPDERIIAAMGRYNDEMTRAGVLVAAEGLHPSAKGVRLRHVAGELGVTDGPFAETKEVLAGFWIIEVNSREEAIAWASRCPLGADPSQGASDRVDQIEVRQITEAGDFPTDADEAWRRDLAMASAAPGGEPAGAGSPRFLMMFMADRASEAGIPPSERLVAEMGDLMGEMARAGVLLAGDGLQPSAKGARVTFARGRRTVIDGPFTETKELIAGYAIIQVQSKDEAIAWAGRGAAIDAAGRGESEVLLRQIFEPADFPPELLARAARGPGNGQAT